MLVDSGSEDVRRESLHLAFLAFASGVGILSSILGGLIRRDLKRNDADKAALAADVEKLDEKVDANDRRHGYEIADIKIAVGPLFTKAQLEQPDYPSR